MIKNNILLSFLILFCSELFAQQSGFKTPPKEILELADFLPAPAVSPDKTGRNLVFLTRPAYKTLEEISETELKLAGIRFNPSNLNASRTNYYINVEIMETETGKKVPVTGLPSSYRVEYVGFSPQNNFISFVNVLRSGMELWTINLKNGVAKKISDANLSAVTGYPYAWSADEKSLYCRVNNRTISYPEEKELPSGPSIQDATGSKAPARTFTDLLKNPNDEKKFEYYAACSFVKIDLASLRQEEVLPRNIYRSMRISPDGNYFMATSINKPYSYTLPYSRFPYTNTLYDASGKKIMVLVDKPLQDNIPQGFSAVEKGRREMGWRADEAATLFWVEALDEGDPAKDVPFRDRLFQLSAPFTSEPRPIAMTINRYSGITWGNKNIAVLEDYWWKNRNRKIYIIDPSTDNLTPKAVFDLSSEDLYAQPGNFSTRYNNQGEAVLQIRNGKMYLEGEGCSPEGNKPFLDEFNIADGTKKRLWQAEGKSTYEQIVRVLDYDKGLLLTRIESQKEYPNYYLRNIGKNEPKKITNIPNPFKAIEEVTKKKIYYKRADGVDLSATLFTPPGYDAKKDGKLPVLMEAYPTEFKDSKAAGQISESPHRFVGLNWASPVFWVLRGYAVLQNAQFPIIGKGKEEPNDTYVPQLVANAAAAIHALDSLGVGDPARVAVMGHSYGAFMTANLLAHSNLFAAGIARSGAYNRSLTPFGFQSEERNYWEAMKIYNEMAPFNYADKIKTPLLMIHGDADNNPGTFTLQSERMFQAIKGLGGIARLVLLPNESHSYAAKENILHMLWEMDSWLDKYVKNKK